MNALVYALSSFEFTRVTTCENVKDIWHEGTNQVKKSKIDLFTHQYEHLRMDLNDTIKDMHTKFTNVVNGAKTMQLMNL